MTEPQTPVKDEIGKQTVIFLFGVAGTLVTFWISELMTDADQIREFKMRTALRVKRIAGWQLEFWEGVSAKAANYYHKETNG